MGPCGISIPINLMENILCKPPAARPALRTEWVMAEDR